MDAAENIAFMKITSNESCPKLNSLQKTQWTHISVYPRSGDRGIKHLPFFKWYTIMVKWVHFGAKQCQKYRLMLCIESIDSKKININTLWIFYVINIIRYHIVYFNTPTFKTLEPILTIWNVANFKSISSVFAYTLHWFKVMHALGQFS